MVGILVLSGIGVVRGDSTDSYGTRYTQAAALSEGLVLGKFVLTPNVTLATAFDDNIFGIENNACARTDSNGRCIETLQPVSGTLTTARGSFLLKLPFSHSYATLTWVPQVKKYANFTAPRSTSQVFSFLTTLNFANGSILSVFDDYVDGFDSYRRLGSRGELQYGSADFTRQHPGFQYEWTFGNQWGTSARLEQTSQTYGTTEAVDFSAVIGGQGEDRSGIVDLFDFNSSTLEVRGYRNFSRMRVYAATVVGRTSQDKSNFVDSQQAQCREDRDPDGDGTPNSTLRCPRGEDSERIAEYDVSLGVTGQILARTQGDVRFGYARWQFDKSAASDFTGLVIATRFDHMFSDRMTGFLGIERRPQQSPSTINGYYLRTDLLGGLERKLSMRTTARASLRVFHYHFSGDVTRAAESFNDYNAEFELGYRPGSATRPGPWKLSLLYNPVRRESSTESIGYVTNRVTLSAQFGWF